MSQSFPPRGSTSGMFRWELGRSQNPPADSCWIHRTTVCPKRNTDCGTGIWFSWKDFKISKCYTGVFSGLVFWEKVLLLASLAKSDCNSLRSSVQRRKKKKKQNNSSQDSDLCHSAHWNIFTARAGYFEAPFTNHQEGSRAPRNVMAKHCFRSTDSPTGGTGNGSEDLTHSKNEYLPLLPSWHCYFRVKLLLKYCKKFCNWVSLLSHLNNSFPCSALIREDDSPQKTNILLTAAPW